MITFCLGGEFVRVDQLEEGMAGGVLSQRVSPAEPALDP